MSVIILLMSILIACDEPMAERKSAYEAQKITIASIPKNAKIQFPKALAEGFHRLSLLLVTITNAQNLELLFSVQVLSCSGSTLFCGAFDAALDLPCTVELRSKANKN